MTKKQTPEETIPNEVIDKIKKIELLPALDPRMGFTYSNFVQVTHTPYDFTLRFCIAPPGDDVVRMLQEDEKVFDKGFLEVTNMVEVKMPAGIMQSFTESLRENVDRYNSFYGEDGEDENSD